MDLSPLRASRDLRLIVLGSTLTGLGTQATLVALPYQLYVQTHSPAQTGLLGAFELVPLVAMSLYGGALADRVDRRRLLLLVQVALVLLSGALAAGAFVGEPPVALLYLLGALLAGGNAVQNVMRASIVPNVVPPDRLRPALALSFGLMQVTMVVGPALGGVLIAVGGLGTAYTIDALTCLGMVASVLPLSPQAPRGAEAHDVGVWRSIVDGLRFVRSRRALLGSFVVDLSAMTFGMPRTLFPVLSLSVYHAGATGTGLLNASVSVGATVAALTAGWLNGARRLGRIVVAAVVVWGLAIAVAGAVPSLGLALVMLAVAGAADSVSSVCRSTINQTVTPDAMRGRMSSVYSLVVQSGPRLGDVEGGAVASLASPRFSVVSGGLACVAAAGLIAVAFPALMAYDADVAEAELAEATRTAAAA
ncbi:MFS transporter, partial [Patulibacter sp. S7RM1-6]